MNLAVAARIVVRAAAVRRGGQTGHYDDDGDARRGPDSASDWRPHDGVPIPSGMTPRALAVSLVAAVGLARPVLAQTPPTPMTPTTSPTTSPTPTVPTTPPTPTTNQTTRAPMRVPVTAADGGTGGGVDAGVSWTGNRLGVDGGVVR